MLRDDDLTTLAARGLPPLPAPLATGYAEHRGARLWHAAYGRGRPVFLLHGGLGHSGYWAYQIPALMAAGWRAIVIDTRGHGRSTLGREPLSYRLLADDLRAVMDRLAIAAAPVIGWSDGADTGLVAALETPERVTGLFFFACNVDPSGTRPFVMMPAIGRVLARHQRDYAALSPTPDGFPHLQAVVDDMQGSQPDLGAADLARVPVPVTVAIGTGDEFIRREHMDYLARTLPHARLEVLPDVTHFAPLQRPELFNEAILRFLDGLARTGP